MERLKTPYYVIDKAELDKNFIEMKQAFEREWNNLIIGYSFKTNSLPWIIDYLKVKGCYAEVVSHDEYELAKLLDYPLEKIIYNGPIKSEKSLIEALEGSSIVNLDSFHEIEWIKKNYSLKQRKEWKVGLRINFDLERKCSGETIMGIQGGRFGFNYENGSLEKAIWELKLLKDIRIEGIHLHTSSKTRSLNIYKSLAEMAVEIKPIFSEELSYIDIGGGFFGGGDYNFKFAEYAKAISEILKKQYSPEKTKLIIEPGAALIATPIKFVCSAVDVKKIKNHNIVVVNGSCNNLNPLMREKKYSYEIKNENQPIAHQIVAGYTCMENDILLNLRDEKEIKVGDKIEFLKVGSYTLTLSPLFIEYFPTVLVKDGDTEYYARKRWTPKEFMQKNYINSTQKIDLEEK